jgi:hypothetical protein
LANEKSYEMYRRRPFSAGMHIAEIQEGRFVWGQYNAAAKAGYSAMVSFDLDGSNPEVMIYYSSDISNF